MLKSIDYLRYNKKTDSFVYNIIDTEFECNITVPFAGSVAKEAAIAVITEYKNRNYSHQEIVKNLFRCNLYLNNKYKYSFEESLNKQYKYLDKYFNDLKNMYDKYKVFM